jgi:hypothetical protein
MTPLRNGPVLGFLTGWLVLAALLVGSGRLAPVPPPGPQLLLVTLTLGLVRLERRAGWLRRWVAGVDLRVLVALHLTRFVGVPILLAGRSGRLPESFATPTGLGDVAVAADPASMEAIVRLPFGLLPTWLVPVLLATHLWIFRRLSAGAAAGPA